MNKDKNLKIVMASLAALGASMMVGQVQAKAKKSEKCYGIVKKLKNDCGTKEHACAGQAKRDGMGDEWIFLPPGACQKIVGGSTKPTKQPKKKS